MAATTSLKSAVASGGCTKAPTWSIAEPSYSQSVGDHPPTVVRRSSIIGAMPRLRRPTSPARDSSDVRNGPRLTDGCSDRHAFAGSPDDTEDFGGFVAGAAEPVRHLGIECGHFAGRRL